MIMTGNEYQALAERTINWEMGKYNMALHAMFGMASEVGELHTIHQKHYQGHPVDDRHLKEELGDLLWFAAELCTAYGWKMEDVMNENIEKLKKRYPDGFSIDRSINREVLIVRDESWCPCAKCFMKDYCISKGRCGAYQEYLYLKKWRTDEELFSERSQQDDGRLRGNC